MFWWALIWNHEVSECSKFPVSKGLLDHEEVEPMLWIVMKQSKKQKKSVCVPDRNDRCFFSLLAIWDFCCCLCPLHRSFDVSIVKFHFFAGQTTEGQQTDKLNCLILLWTCTLEVTTAHIPQFEYDRNSAHALKSLQVVTTFVWSVHYFLSSYTT